MLRPGVNPSISAARTRVSVLQCTVPSKITASCCQHPAHAPPSLQGGTTTARWCYLPLGSDTERLREGSRVTTASSTKWIRSASSPKPAVVFLDGTQQHGRLGQPQATISRALSVPEKNNSWAVKPWPCPTWPAVFIKAIETSGSRTK